ncbi:MAG: TMEM14 family protein [Verrucomicrobiota bacterium]|nr:TMEM14 family protein [Limisphaera sp.]MDW8381334.1 TMEM14 family protein [Verrucomicrobiota bacterium]
MTPDRVLWVYIVLLVAGGLVGWLKAGSKVSLVVSLLFAVALSACALNWLRLPLGPDLLLLCLILLFGWRLLKTKNFMPAGLMLIVTTIALALRHWSW